MIDSNKVLKYCKDLGFDLIGTVHAHALKARLPALQKRRELGYCTPFENADVDLRVAPERILPGVKSILVLGIGYAYKQLPLQKGPLFKARVAKYGRGMDYHKVLKTQMQKVVEYLHEEAGDFEYKILVDSSPLLERFLAELTGQGWIGQNTCFYSKTTGSWIFLGEILLTLDLEVGRMVLPDGRCLECSRCIKACPTGALKGNYIMDANRCLAYITQAKETIPRQYRKLIGSNIMGCDICQDVCPNNKGILEKIAGELKPLPHLSEVDLSEILLMSNAEYKEKYGAAAYSWCGKKVLQRNCLVALGNLKAREAVPLIASFLESPNRELRLHAAWALGEIGGDLSEGSLKNRLKVEEDPLVILEIQAALVNLHNLDKIKG
ncbi:MAG: tRNA epoxyqueuosine(34) reductase QueG [Bacillota bacterium]